jgi:hypothetical protein
MILDVIERVRSFPIIWHATFSPSGLKVILPRFRAKAIRLKAKVLHRAHGNKKASAVFGRTRPPGLTRITGFDNPSIAPSFVYTKGVTPDFRVTPLLFGWRTMD